MAFTRPTGKHRRPSRLSRTTASAAGVAALTTTGVISGLAAPALAAEGSSAEYAHTGLTQSISIGDSLADEIDAQAAAQKQAADEAAAKAKAEAEAKAKAAEAKRKAAEAKRKAEAAAKAKAKEEREAKERAAREAERKRLMGSYVAPIDGSYVSTGYKTGGAMWSSGSHTGVDFHAASGTKVQAVAAGTVVEAGWGGAYGNNVVIRHNDGTYTQYGHMSSLSVTVGQAVTPGQQIGLSGSTGNSSGPHLHFEARTGADYGSDIDPVAYLRSHGVNV